ncbi:arginine--tRNA ligase [Paenibacillus sp. J5C_2022]|uniref:arginine--tRNA ligase n=1 Tax=Paenibacillus sp. J5C2022 TaxID=2977129 RepID=UPI0021D2346E|nr:arginine--tRNA ligase [Paenibacillus sp. J5C2022]MCU6708002.1 arginine--tRNA ligase [Paenibacillus sp. J5C2022]
MDMNQITRLISPHVPLPEEEVRELLQYPPNPEMGDVALPCFTLAKLMKRSPQQIAQSLADAIEHPAIRAEAAGPYLNFKLDRAGFAEALIRAAASGQFWHVPAERPERIIIDMSSPNIAKPFGIGHLRSTMIGNAVSRILREIGHDTVNVNHLGDWGTQFGKMIAAYMRWGDTVDLEQQPIKGYLQLYVQFHDEAERNPQLEEEARSWFQRLEAGDEQATSLWRSFIAESMREFNKLYERLGVSFNHVLGESFYNDKMDAVVQQLAEQSLLEDSDGAKVVRLEEQGMPPCLILKSDGTSIYATRDLATALYRHREMGGDRLLYVVGGEQTLHFRQVFQVLKKMGCDWAEQCRHIPFGLMRLKGQKMSTRRGQVVFLEDVLNEAVDKALVKIEQKNPSLHNKRQIAEAIGLGAVVFGDLKNSRTLDIDFSLEEMLNFDGETGPYLQYTYARTASILRKAEAGLHAATGGLGSTPSDDDSSASASRTDASPAVDTSTSPLPQMDYSQAENPYAWALITTLNHYPERLLQAAERYEPSVLARYLLDLAQGFNRYYHHVKVLSGQPSEVRMKLELVSLVSQVLRRGLHLLGLATPEEI